MGLPQQSKSSDAQKGVALLVVLLLVATLSVLALAMTTTMRQAVGRSVATGAQDQAMWYALGTEQFAAYVLKEQAKIKPGVDIASEPWLLDALTLPVEGGLIQARLRDATNCFNLNALVRLEAGNLIVNAEAKAEYIRLLVDLGLDQLTASDLSDILVDWLDSDTFPEGNGAEDETYLRQTIPYRAGNTLLANVSELRAIANYTDEFVTKLAPFVCAQPVAGSVPMNINLLHQRKAPLLSAAMGDLLTLEEAQQILAQRPLLGYETAEAFWALPVFSGKTIPEEAKQRLQVWSGFVRVEADITLARSYLTMSSLLVVTADGVAKPVTRVYGARP